MNFKTICHAMQHDVGILQNIRVYLDWSHAQEVYNVENQMAKGKPHSMNIPEYSATLSVLPPKSMASLPRARTFRTIDERTPYVP